VDLSQSVDSSFMWNYLKDNESNTLHLASEIWRGVSGAQFYQLLYIELTFCFLIGQKLTVNFRNQRLGHHLAADYTIIMSRTLKVMDNHVMYDRDAWFLRVICSAVFCHALCCLPSVKKQKHDFLFFVQCIIKQSLGSVFVISK